MSILAKRAQQATFAAAAAMNRAASTGTGAGFQSVQILASQIHPAGQTLTGVAGPPLGRTGFGGRVTVNTITFTPTRTSDVLLVGLIHGLVNTGGGGGQDTQAPMNFRIDTVLDTQNMSLPDYGPAAAGQYNGTAVLWLVVPGMAPTSHTVLVEWNSEQGANDTLHDYFDAIYAFQLSA